MSSHPQHFDLNVPLPTSRRKHQAQICQDRLHQLGYHGIAFCHHAFGRLKPERDDADKTLPWNQLLASHVDMQNQTHFGRQNSLGMKVYRRLNIVFEEASDVSHFFIPSSTAGVQQTTRELIEKYDIVSLQPMNEPVLQSICEFLSQSDAANSNKSLSNHLQIINLEYAVGSRGGHGLPYKLRKDYVVKVLEAGLTFELSYSAAMLDPKRRNGFLRALVDFQSAFSGIQKKHMLLNKHIHSHQYNQTKCKSEQFPLLLSSGSRQNFTKGTDEGVMGLRSPDDVAFVVNNLIAGNGLGSSDNLSSSCKAGNGNRKKTKRIICAAEKVLAKAREDKMGMITFDEESGAGSRIECVKRKRAMAIDSLGYNQGETSDDDNDSPCHSLRDWLSKSLDKMQKVDMTTIDSKKAGDEIITVTRPLILRMKASLQVKEKESKEPPTDATDEGDDLEDGYIAL